MSATQHRRSGGMSERDEVLSTIAKEISAIKKEHSRSLATLRQNLGGRDYENMTLDHYNPKIEKLQNELGLLKAKLEDKETGQAKKIGYLLDEFSIGFEEIVLQINVAMNSIKLKYEILKDNGFEDQDDLDEILGEVGSLKQQFRDVWFKSLADMSENLLLAVSRASGRVLRRIRPYLEVLFSNNIMFDMLSNDMIVKKHVANCHDQLVGHYRRLDNLESYLRDVKRAARKTAAAPRADREIDNPPFVSAINAATESNDKLASEIHDIRNVIENELNEIQNANLERENKWQVFLENERNKHKELLEQIRMDYQSSLLNEQRSMINHINDVIEDQSRQVVNRELEADATSDDVIYRRFAKDHRDLFDQSYRTKQMLLEKEIESLSDSVETKIDSRLDDLIKQQNELDEKKNAYLDQLKAKIDLIRKTSFAPGRAAADPEPEPEAPSNPYEGVSAPVYSEPTLNESEKAIVSDQPRASQEELISQLTDTITDRIVTKLNSEVDRIYAQNSANFNAMAQAAPLPVIDQPFPSEWQDLSFAADPTVGYAPAPEYFAPQPQPPQAPFAQPAPAQAPEEQTTFRRARFLGQDPRGGRLSSEDIRKYANSIISVNRKKMLKSKS